MRWARPWRSPSSARCWPPSGPAVRLAGGPQRRRRTLAPLPARRVLDTIRSVDTLIWALIWINVVGLGPFAGVLAIMTSDIGALRQAVLRGDRGGRPQAVEGVVAARRRRLAADPLRHVPQVLPVIAGQVLYFFESNTRSATIIGIVGAGGIGLHLSEQIRALEWQQRRLHRPDDPGHGRGDRRGLHPPAAAADGGLSRPFAAALAMPSSAQEQEETAMPEGSLARDQVAAVHITDVLVLGAGSAGCVHRGAVERGCRDPGRADRGRAGRLARPLDPHPHGLRPAVRQRQVRLELPDRGRARPHGRSIHWPRGRVVGGSGA